MNNHPLNLGLRFLLELAALAAMAVWGWQKGAGWLRFVFAIGIPLVAAILWGTFRVPNDPGAAPVAVPGLVRLTLELAYFGFAVYALASIDRPSLAWGLGAALVLHYALSYDRIIWMIGQS